MSTLRVEEKITLAAPVERTWRFLLDPADVAACLPGASLDSVEDERNFTGTMKVKVGPVTTEFKGKATFTEILPEEHKVELVASGNDKGGSGSAKMTMHSRIVATPDGGSELLVVADVDIAGKLVRFGRGMMEGVGKQLFKVFAERVQARLAGPEAGPPAVVEGAAAEPAIAAALGEEAVAPLLPEELMTEAPAEPGAADAAPSSPSRPPPLPSRAPAAPALAASPSRALARPPQDNAPLDAGNLVWAAFWAWLKALLARLLGRKA